MDIFENFLEIIYIEIEDKEKENKFSKKQLNTFYILYPILILDTLIFNEIFILKFCGFYENTKKYIMERGNSEFNNHHSKHSIADTYEESEEDDENENNINKNKDGKIIYLDDKELVVYNK